MFRFETVSFSIYEMKVESTDAGLIRKNTLMQRTANDNAVGLRRIRKRSDESKMERRMTNAIQVSIEMLYSYKWLSNTSLNLEYGISSGISPSKFYTI